MKKEGVIALIISAIILLSLIFFQYGVKMELKSSVFEHNGKIPSKYTCDSENINPPLSISGVPESAKSLVLIMDDPDIPQEIKSSRGIEVFDHWVVFDIPPQTAEIAEGQSPQGIQGNNGAGNPNYTGPCPPSQYSPKEHRYFFKLYALDTELSLSEGSTKAQVEEAMKNHVLAQTELTGRYERI